MGLAVRVRSGLAGRAGVVLVSEGEGVPCTEYGGEYKQARAQLCRTARSRLLAPSRLSKNNLGCEPWLLTLLGSC